MIVVRHRGHSSLQGTESSFDKDVVTIGRRSQNDIVFDPETDRLVSGNHAELRRAEEVLIVRDLGSTNGTYVNGKRLSGDHVITAGDRVTLGSNGPEFSAFLSIEVPIGGAPVTEGAARAMKIPSGSAEIASALAAAAASADRTVSVGNMGIQAGPGAAPIAGVSLDSVANSQRKTLSALIAKGIGPTTLTRILRQERQRTLASVFLIVIPIVLAASGWMWWRIAHERPTSVVIPAVAMPTKADIINGAKPAVYLACLRRNGTSDSDTGFGTAWGVGENVCATNAHVARVFLDRKPKETVVLRSCRPPHAELRVIDAVLHPGYPIYSQLVEAIKPFDPNTGKVYQADSPTDVALLVIHPDDVQKAATPLPIATADELARLQAGDEVMYVGYPQENTQGGGVDVHRPEPAAGANALTKISDSFYGRGDAADSIVLTYGFDAIGGASGSPVLNRRGRVIGLMAAGNGGGVGAGGERILLGAIGPRVDLVRELLDHTAEKNQERRTEYWRRHLLDLFRRGVSDASNLPVRIADSVATSSQVFKIEGLKSATFDKELTEAIDPNSKRAIFKLPPTNARTVIVLASQDVPVKMNMKLTRGRREDQITGLDALPYLCVENVPPNTDVKVEAFGSESEFGVAKTVKLYVFKAVK